MDKKIICPNCGRKLAGDKNFFGKLCMKCGHEIPATDECDFDILSDNKNKKDNLFKVLQSLLWKDKRR